MVPRPHIIHVTIQLCEFRPRAGPATATPHRTWPEYLTRIHGASFGNGRSLSPWPCRPPPAPNADRKWRVGEVAIRESDDAQFATFRRHTSLRTLRSRRGVAVSRALPAGHVTVTAATSSVDARQDHFHATALSPMITEAMSLAVARHGFRDLVFGACVAFADHEPPTRHVPGRRSQTADFRVRWSGIWAAGELTLGMGARPLTLTRAVTRVCAGNLRRSYRPCRQ